ncbi:putative coil containing protein [Vibrio phage 236O40-1]|nr:putative coil containing protein [Vibrio phage 236O40-1]
MKFMNLNKWLYSNPQDKADDGGQGGGGGDTGGDDKSDMMPQMSWADFDAHLEKKLNERMQTQKPPADDKTSITDERKQRQDEESKRQQDQAVVQNAAVFDSNFDSYIEANKDLFPETVKTVRADVKETDLVKKTNLIAATAAKEFFSIQSNIDVLDSDSKRKVQEDILNKRYESDIDGVAAWDLVKRSVFGSELSNKNKKTHDFSGGGKGKTGLKNLDNYMENFYPKHVRAIEA